MEFLRREGFVKLLLLLSLLIIFVTIIPPMGVDFTLLYPAGRAILEFKNPYLTAPLFFNPPWLLLLLTPVSIFVMPVARWIWFLLAFSSYLVAFKKMGFSIGTQILLFASPFIYFDLGIGNCEWLVVLGASMLPQTGSWLVVLKPQTSFILLVLWFRQGYWEVLFPCLLLLFLLVFGIWSLPTREMPWSADIFPWGIPVGLLLGFLAFKRDDWRLALAAAPFLSPYLAFQSWIYILFPLTSDKRFLAVGIIASWVFTAMFFQR